jgi:hypothetical protein
MATASGSCSPAAISSATATLTTFTAGRPRVRGHDDGSDGARVSVDLVGAKGRRPMSLGTATGAAARLRPVGGRVALSFEEAPFGLVGGQLDGAGVGGDSFATTPSTGEEVGAGGVVRLVVLELGHVE